MEYFLKIKRTAIPEIWLTYMLILLVASFPIKSLAAEYPWQLSIGGLYSKGYDAEAGRTLEWYLLPLALKHHHQHWTVQFVSTYLIADELNTEDQYSYSGKGDTQVKLTYLFNNPVFKHWWVDVSWKIKFPTADEDTELTIGTGERDYWLDIELMRVFMSGWFGHIGGGKKFRGKSAELELLDSYYLNTSIGRRWAEHYAAGMQWEFMEASSQSGDDVIEAMVYSSYRLSSQNSLLVYLSKGFTDSSSEYGTGLQFTHRFGRL